MNPIISVLVEGFVPGLLVGGALLLVMPWLKRDSDWRLLPVAIVLALFSGQKASSIGEIDAEAVLRELGLDEHLSPQRANGLRSMVKRIKQDASAALHQTA